MNVHEMFGRGRPLGSVALLDFGGDLHYDLDPVTLILLRAYLQWPIQEGWLSPRNGRQFLQSA